MSNLLPPTSINPTTSRGVTMRVVNRLVKFSKGIPRKAPGRLTKAGKGFNPRMAKGARLDRLEGAARSLRRHVEPLGADVVVERDHLVVRNAIRANLDQVIEICQEYEEGISGVVIGVQDWAKTVGRQITKTKDKSIGTGSNNPRLIRNELVVALGRAGLDWVSYRETGDGINVEIAEEDIAAAREAMSSQFPTAEWDDHGFLIPVDYSYEEARWNRPGLGKGFSDRRSMIIERKGGMGTVRKGAPDRDVSGLVAQTIRRYYPHLKSNVEDIIQTLYTLGWDEEAPHKDKLRIISRAASQVSRELGYHKTREGKWVREFSYGAADYMEPSYTPQDEDEGEPRGVSASGGSEEPITRQNWRDFLGKVPDRVIAEVLGVNPTTIAYHRNKMGTAPTIPKLSPAEEQVILDNYQTLSAPKIGAMINRDAATVLGFLKRRGLQTFQRGLSEKEKQVILDNYQVLSPFKIAQMIGRDAKTVRAFLVKHGLGVPSEVSRPGPKGKSIDRGMSVRKAENPTISSLLAEIESSFPDDEALEAMSVLGDLLEETGNPAAPLFRVANTGGGLEWPTVFEVSEYKETVTWLDNEGEDSDPQPDVDTDALQTDVSYNWEDLVRYIRNKGYTDAQGLNYAGPPGQVVFEVEPSVTNFQTGATTSRTMFITGIGGTPIPQMAAQLLLSLADM